VSSDVAAIAAGEGHTCALLASTGGVQCWGQNTYGQLGDGTTTDRLVPTSVVGLSSSVAAIAAGPANTCALLASGGVQCWGSNGNGQVGDGTTTPHLLVPTTVVGLSSSVAAIAAGQYHMCALLASTGGMQCWGLNNYGQLGVGTTTNWPGAQFVPPTSVVGLSTSVAVIATGVGHTCALLASSSRGVQCWGYNANGQLGDGTTTQRLVPNSVSSPSPPSPPPPSVPPPPAAPSMAAACTNLQYTVVDDPSRDYQAAGGCRNDGDAALAEGWYRFQENGREAKIPMYPEVPEAWQTGGTERSSRLLLQQHPSVSDGVITAIIAFPWGAGVRIPIQIVNCGAFYLYYHTPFSSPTHGGLGGCSGAPCGYVLQLL
jgi:hypothetical protein